MSDLVGNPKDRFSRVAAHMAVTNLYKMYIMFLIFRYFIYSEKIANLLLVLFILILSLG